MGEIWPFIGAVRTTPMAKPLNTNRTRVTAAPALGPASRYTVPRASHGTFTMAPNMKKMRNEPLLHPRPSAHHRANEATTNRAIAIVQANSCGFRRRSQRSKVLSPNARATMAAPAARAVFKVTLKQARGNSEEFVNE